MRTLFKNVWFKCITALLLIAAVSGGLLSVLNDVLFVSAEEHTDRAIVKIYGELKQYDVEYDAAQDGAETIDYGYGRIDKVFTVDNGADYLFKTTGYRGYKEGTITLWVRVSVNGGVYSIEKVVLESYEKQTLMSKLGGEYYGKFRLSDVTAEYKAGRLFSATDEDKNYNAVSGATFSATAGNNAVNCVLKYLSDKETANED
ncbi:MAG: FMN-binding protein [Clostridia bacterium]|nr:FMN-binding protein [Clostridia bacterium]